MEFDGIDTAARVTLDSVPVLVADNAHRKHVISVPAAARDRARAGKAVTLEVALTSPLAAANAAAAACVALNKTVVIRVLGFTF